MLNGIGGSTVAEAKETLTYEEYLAWCAYVKKRGTLNFGMRLEMASALLAQVTNNSMGGKAKMEDFMPHKDAEEISIQDLFNGFKNIAHHNNLKKKKAK